MRTIVAGVLSAVLLAGCQQSSTVRDPASGGFRQLQGGELVLRQALTVPPGRARVFLQDGSDGAVAGRFDQYRPHCALEIDRVDHAGLTIEPGRFLITRVQHSLVEVVQAEPVQVAARNLAFGIYGRSSSAYHEGYHLWLASQRQPSVRRLSCYGVYAEPPDLAPPTLAEIRWAIGGVAEIVP